MNATNQRFFTIGNAATMLRVGPAAVREAMQDCQLNYAMELNGVGYVDADALAKLRTYFAGGPGAMPNRQNGNTLSQRVI